MQGTKKQNMGTASKNIGNGCYSQCPQKPEKANTLMSMHTKCCIKKYMTKALFIKIYIQKETVHLKAFKNRQKCINPCTKIHKTGESLPPMYQYMEFQKLMENTASANKSKRENTSNYKRSMVNREHQTKKKSGRIRTSINNNSR